MLLMMSNYFRQYITEYTVANFRHYPIRGRITNSSALELPTLKEFAKFDPRMIKNQGLGGF